MIDIHTHILPNFDDGSASVEISVNMLKALREQGVKNVVLTPHFYDYRTDVDSFVQKRQKALDVLIEEL